MPQHDYNVIGAVSGAAYTADLNNALAAIVSQNSGPAAPATTFAFQWWADTTSGFLKLRNAANSLWITIGTLADPGLGLAPLLNPAFQGTTGLSLPAGSTAQRPGAPVAGHVRLNNTLGEFEGWNGVDWGPFLRNPQSLGGRNRVINGAFIVDQEYNYAAQTINTARYVVDQWLAYATGGTVIGEIITGPSVAARQYRFAGGAGVTSVGLQQRIESFSCSDLAGKKVILSVDLADTLLTAVTWQVQRCNTQDNWSASTLVASGFFSGISSTVTRFTTPPIDIPAAGANGLAIDLIAGAQTSGTFTIGDVQLEPGTIATPMEHRTAAIELAQCQRYFQWAPFSMRFRSSVASEVDTQCYPLPVLMRNGPTVGSLVADPGGPGLFNNNSLNTMQIIGGSSALLTLGAGAGSTDTYLLGFRAALSSRLL